MDKILSNNNNTNNETTNHLVCECSKLAQIEYKKRHDNVARIVHWNLVKLHRLDVAEKWYDHKPEGVMEGDGTKLLWDFNIQTDKEIQARRPDLVVVNRKDNQCFIIDIAVPNDSGIFEKEKEKIEKYQDLRRQIAKLWSIKTSVVPIVVGTLGTVTNNRLGKHLKTFGVTATVELLQKAALLGTARILRKVLEA